MKQKELRKNLYKLNGSFATSGYDWWWHSFTAYNEKTMEEKPFYIEYFIINPKVSPEKYILGSKGKPSYFMVNCGCWCKNKAQLHRFYNVSDIKIDKKKLFITGEDFLLSEERIKGKVIVHNPSKEELSDSGEMEWDILLEKEIPYDVGYGTSPLFCGLKAFDMYWHAQGIKTLMKGYVVYNNERYIVKPKTSYGYSDKNWGRDFTSPWVWLSSWDLVSELTKKRLNNSAIEIGGGRPRAFGITFHDKLLIDFFYEGTKYEFNFSKFWAFPKVKFDCYETNDRIIWEISASKANIVLKTHFECKKKDMLLINYEAPNGERKFHRLYNGGNGFGVIELYKDNLLVDRIQARHTGCEYGKYHSEGDDYTKK
jgi:tocopherol cyclase